MHHECLLLICRLLALSGLTGVAHAADQLPHVSRPVPDGPLGDSIQLGRDLVENTTSHSLSKPYTGNALNCTSCHLKNGK